MLIALTRDSVCLADDGDAPHAGEIRVADDATLRQIARAVWRSGYLAFTWPATWHVAAGGAAVVFGRGRLFYFAHQLGAPSPLARDLPALDFRYHAQRRPDEVCRTVAAGLGRA